MFLGFHLEYVKLTRCWVFSFVGKWNFRVKYTSDKMTVATLPPLPRRFLVGPRYKAKLKKTHCYKLRHIREDKLKLRRLGSGFFQPVVLDSQPVMLDSLILGHLLPRMPVNNFVFSFIHSFIQDVMNWLLWVVLFYVTYCKGISMIYDLLQWK